MSDQVPVPPSPGSKGDDPDSFDEYRRVLRRYVRAQRSLLTREFTGSLNAYVAFRNAVLDAIESDEVISDTSTAIVSLHQEPGMAEVAHLLVMELEAFSAASESSEAPVAAAGQATRPWWKRALGIGKTTTDSLREILEKYLGPKAKAVWKLLSELAEIVSGD